MDRTSKVIFALIAAGLWFEAATTLLRPVHAQQNTIAAGEIAANVESIARSLEILVAGGATCTNKRVWDRKNVSHGAACRP